MYDDFAYVQINVNSLLINRGFIFLIYLVNWQLGLVYSPKPVYTLMADFETPESSPPADPSEQPPAQCIRCR